MPNTSKNEKMELEQLYKLAEDRGVHVMDFSLPENKAVTIDMGKECFVGVDPEVFGRECEEKVVLAHEMGHIATGGLYSVEADKTSRKKQEARAEKWAIERLVPKEALKDAIKNGCQDVQSLAEHFGVTEEYMSQVLVYYLEK